MKTQFIIILVVMLFLVCSSFGFDGQDYEEPAGASFTFLLNPEDNIYGASLGSGTWIINTPIFGDYFLGIFSNEIEGSWYSGVGMTIRIMPHWRVAPFIGGGGSYNYSFPDYSNNPDYDEYKDEELEDRGDSYWGGHAEAGIRVWTRNRVQLFELMGRYTWSSLEGDRDYWMLGIGLGAND